LIELSLEARITVGGLSVPSALLDEEEALIMRPRRGKEEHEGDEEHDENLRPLKIDRIGVEAFDISIKNDEWQLGLKKVRIAA
jgi:hypothetical protein